MASSRFSSGHLLADRRFEYARAYAEAGDHQAAADLYSQALELVPGWLPALVGAADAALATGQIDRAAALLRDAEALDQQGLFGAGLKLAALGLAATPSAPPPAYVRSLFDGYADRFEAALTEDLGYRAPWLIADRLASLRPERPFSRALDLGCGTGLMAVALAGRVGHFTGCDLSAAMVAQARIEQRYQALAVADAVSFLDTSADVYDLITAADVLVYVGALEPLFAAVAGRLTAGGLFAFTVEEADADALVLRDSLRYAHGEAYVRRAAAAAGLAILDLDRATLRQDRGQAIAGLIVVAATS